MKKIISLIFVLLMVLSFSTIASAKTVPLENDYVKENEFTLISYQGLRGLLKEDKLESFEDSVWNLLNLKDSLNIKHVTFMGPFTTGSTYQYGTTVQKEGKTIAEMYNLANNHDTPWLEQYENLAEIATILNEEGIPYGVNYSFTDYPSASTGIFITRDNHKTKFFNLVDTVQDGVDYDYINDSNFYIVVENNGVKYMIFQLEVWPAEVTLDWFNTVVKDNQDKYVIVYTASFTDASGKMYKMWDRSLSGTALTESKALANTSLKGVNLQSVDKPRDGDGIWNYSFANFDNVLAVVSNNAKVNDILISKQANERGYETAVITANASDLLAANGPVQLALKFSADNKTVSARYLVPFEGYIDTSDKSVTLSKVATLAEPKKEIPKIAAQYNGANKAYIVGYEGNLFKPQNNMRRSEACTIFARLILGTQDIPAGYTTRFTDVKEGEWYYNAVAYLDESGFFEQLTSDKYDPQGYITRAEFVDLANKASTLAADKNVEFSDVTSDHFYYDSIMAAASSGLVGGYTDGTFKPDKTITRAEVVTVLNRLLGISATEKYISPDKLENKFSDISSHWANLDILMASNSDVHGEYYYEASLDGVTETDRAFIFKNNHFEFTLDKKSARVSSFKNLYNGEDINNNQSDPYFIYQTKLDGGKILPTEVHAEGNRLCFTFKNGTKVYMLVEVLDDYMTFEIDSKLAPGMATVSFANFKVEYSTNDYRLNAMGMTAWCRPVNGSPYGKFKTAGCTAYSYFEPGDIGSKYAVNFASEENAIKICQQVADAVDTTVGLASKAGGAYAKDWEPNYGDYVIYSNIKPEQLDYVIEMCKKYGIDQLDIHQSEELDGGSFLQGTFEWCNFESHEDFYENFGKKLHENGIIYALHSYAHYISYEAYEYTTNPYWQKQLQTMGDVYTVRKATTERGRNIALEEDATDFDTTTSFFVANSKYVLIDEEIIGVGQGTTSGFINCTRGCMGTTPARHYPGAKVYHLQGHFGLLVPEYGSELFYEIADRMADAYNRAGFDMLYFDAIDGMTGDSEALNAPAGAQNYYAQMFVHRVVSQCQRPPIVESAAGSAQEFNVRGRIGAHDTSVRAIKLTITSHTSQNMTRIKDYNLVATLGWFTFFPDRAPTAGMKNTLEKTMFRDDIDVVGLYSVLYDQTMVYNPIASDTDPFHVASIEYFQTYANLRKSHYFTQATKDKLIEMGGEFKIVEKAPGEYAWQQMYYNKANVGAFTGDDSYSFAITNPYGTQNPYIRVESRWSTAYENEQLLVEMDENKSLGTNVTTKTGFSYNLSNKAVLRFKVKGTNRDGDAMLVSLKGGGTLGRGRIDYFIDLNYDGWREFTVLDADNCEYDVSKYSFSGIQNVAGAWETIRETPPYNAIDQIYIRLCGSTAINAQMSSIYAYKQVKAVVENPTVTVGASSITFNTTIEGGNYIEYFPETNKAYQYDNYTQTSKEITFTGSLSVPAGNSVGKYTATATDTCPVRAKVVLGFAGQTVDNIK